MRKIKITFIHYELVFGGAEQALFDLVNLLDKEKCHTYQDHTILFKRQFECIITHHASSRLYC